ncbi:response regulator [Microbulbifer celer]|uniref:Response regulator n=1 Tax=Microbulbifer celer TaxID=435905 RepID=A0ABW3U9U5_9GAMM|nr:response regulator transcription factor [Microbulbifer celer]UFN58789.1 response regulator transcription factor [Microbulbifer celer]
MNILLVEDDPLLAQGLLQALTQAQYSVLHATHGEYADGLLQASEIDLVILDLGLPDMDGADLLRRIRHRRLPIPVLVLTARDGIEQQVEALDQGADDYMEKPFDLRELEARIRALLRRSHKLTADEIRLGTLQLSPFQRTISLGEKRLDLPAREYEILESLMINAPRVVTKARLAQRLSRQGDEVGDNAVEVYIHRLRRRLTNSGLAIRTLRGTGYVLEESD